MNRTTFQDRAYCLLFAGVLVFCPGCNLYYSQSPAPIVAWTEKDARAPKTSAERGGSYAVIIDSPITDNEWNDLFFLELENALVQAKRFCVLAKMPARSRQPNGCPWSGSRVNKLYKISFGVLETIKDLGSDDEQRSAGTALMGHVVSQMAPYASVGTAAVLGPVGGLMSSFDIVTGIPSTWDSKGENGAVGFELAVTEVESDWIVGSFPLHSTFTRKEDRIGKFADMGLVGKVAQIKSTEEEAVQYAAKAAAELILELLEKKNKALPYEK